MYKLIATSFLFLFTVTSTWSQTKDDRAELAKQTITQLKDGALLIRLSSKSQTLELLRERGYPKRADHIEKVQAEKNKEIVKAYSTIGFTKVYFFYSEHSENVRNGNLEGILLDTALNKVTGANIKHYVVGATGPLPKNYEYKESNDDNTPANVTEKKTYGGGSNLSILSFYLMDKNFDLLPDPFPNHQRYHPVILTTLTHEEVAEKIDEKLVKYYEKVGDS